MNKTNTIIIGAGPAGASAAIYLARFCHDVLLFDAPEKAHGRTGMAPDIRNFLGEINAPKGGDFLKRIDTQLQMYPEITRKTEYVTEVRQSEEGFLVVTTEDTYQAKYVILAVGLSDTMPPIDGLDPYYDNAIFHCLTCDWYDRKDKKAAVITNNDRGIQTARMIQKLHRPPSLIVVPSDESFIYGDEAIKNAEQAGIAVYKSPIKELIGEDGFLHQIKLADGTIAETEVLFTKLGHTRFDSFLDKGGVTVDREPEEGFITVDFRTFETSVKNLFAVGPCNNGPDQIIIAGGQGAMAALEIHTRIVDQLI